MSPTRPYVSLKREAQAAATRQAILEAFRDQLTEPGRDNLSPTDAADQAGCSVRTVHSYFPSRESRIEALAEWLEGSLYPEPFLLPTSHEDLPAHYRRIHASALQHPVAAALIAQTGSEWQEVRSKRRSGRLEAVRRVVAAIGAPDDVTAEATAVLLALAGGEVTMIMRDQHGLDPARIPDAIAHTVELVIADLLRQVVSSRAG